MESSTEQHSATARPARTIEWIVWGGVALTIAAIALAFVLSRREPAFTLTNQAGRAFSSADLRGRVWVADVIFTRCPGLCATLTRHMGMLQSALPTNGAIQLVSLTADPEFDTPTVLGRYAQMAQAAPERWQFLTGDKKVLYALAIDRLKFIVREVEPGKKTSDNDLFLHSEKFVLVDKQGRIRETYDGTDTNSIPQIVSDIESLLRE